MDNKKAHNLGIVFRPEHPLEALPAFARRAEKVGFDELWVWEDCFYGGGIAAGKDTIVLVPLPHKGVEELDVFAAHFQSLNSRT